MHVGLFVWTHEKCAYILKIKRLLLPDPNDDIIFKNLKKIYLHKQK